MYYSEDPHTYPTCLVLEWLREIGHQTVWFFNAIQMPDARPFKLKTNVHHFAKKWMLNGWEHSYSPTLQKLDQLNTRWQIPDIGVSGIQMSGIWIITVICQRSTTYWDSKKQDNLLKQKKNYWKTGQLTETALSSVKRLVICFMYCSGAIDCKSVYTIFLKRKINILNKTFKLKEQLCF